MSTSNLDHPTGESLDAASSYLPDVELLTRMANEMFSALPNATPAAGVPSSAAGTSAAASPSALEIPAFPADHPRAGSSVYASAIPLPFEDELNTLLSSAKESYSAVPGLTQTAGAPSAEALTAAPLPAPEISAVSVDHFNLATSPIPSVIPLPFEEELRTLFTPAQKATLAHTTIPANPSQASSFYFLDSIASPATGTPLPSYAAAHPPFDVNAIRRDFPILKELVHGRPLVWLDNAATTQKPQSVIDRLSYFYQHENSNIHRAAHELAARATDAYEDARKKVRHFLNASSVDEIVFVRGTTEGINLVAQSWGRQHINEGDEIVISWLEHHANIVPWQQLCTEKGAKLRVAPVDDHGQILLDEYQKLLNSRTKLVAFSQVSNALGTITPAQQMIAMAHRVGARVLLDGAQSVSHMRVDVQQLDCDWFVFSGHKVFAPTGIGALFGKLELLNSMPPWQGGGNMIQDVTFEKTIYHAAPARFEAGTGNIADAVGLGAAIDYVQRLGLENISRYEHQLLVYATRGLSTIPGLRLIGTAADKAGVLSFVLKGFSSEEVGAALNREGIAVRSGHHCAQPILRRFGLETTVRPSLALYNTCADIDFLVAALRRIQSGRTSF
ncbi:family 2A encapsulin nanocompartment cargo protein cysteine desulfurase [Nitrosomonas sp. Is24]|uniref:family 2A encapsulin nanocompartment cargo protein cysteine desulfurase n=1 Tax=Nitrosomonas sp. Is24 TaxID=3080533 RepID=UPI00294B0AD0|nr:family 2A encapsulin nanocompartment cargo protein cysteine desulfurase [Nitrosomonas sp. Is24]MDV6341923.1 family 2A encapsulin nanocompartment cargo protein cysteine desulfurase [Nitrosomonas sp. Is24]